MGVAEGPANSARTHTTDEYSNSVHMFLMRVADQLSTSLTKREFVSQAVPNVDLQFMASFMLIDAR